LSERPLEPPFVSPEVAEPWQPWKRFQHRYWIHAVLLLLTVVTTTLVGAAQYASYRIESGQLPDRIVATDYLPGGLWYSLTILAILGAHEMGHYLMCRRHQIDATLPYFLPIPLPLTGTLGAFIKIREPFRNRRALFDIGVAGPIAGFVVLIPLLFLGTAMSPAATPPSDPTEGRVVIQLGEPLLFQFAEWVIWGNVNRDWINLHPMAFGAWFGLIATALNLMPFGQLDGGHVSYAVLGRRSTLVSLVTVSAALGLTFVSSSWYAAAGLMVLMLVVFGPRHPRVVDEYEELGRPRLITAVFAAVIFILCFTPAPIEISEAIRPLTTR
jgi:membrane-associated protease RseP (regulator of RpoE activity)